MRKSHSRKRGFWSSCRIYFRRFRIALWLLILAFLGFLVYLNQVGLPDFVKNPLLRNLRARGLDLQFSRLRLRWYQGIVAENVHFGRPEDPSSPQLNISEVKLSLDQKALAKFKFRIDSLNLRQGRLLFPIAETNRASRQLTLE